MNEKIFCSLLYCQKTLSGVPKRFWGNLVRDFAHLLDCTVG